MTSDLDWLSKGRLLLGLGPGGVQRNSLDSVWRFRQPHDEQTGEPPRVQPSKKRTSNHPLIDIGRAAKTDDALAGMERWRARHPEAAAHLEPADVLVDAMRGRFATWTRIRVNLQHVPVDLRPVQETLDPDDAPKSWGPHDEAEWKRQMATARPRGRTRDTTRDG